MSNDGLRAYGLVNMKLLGWIFIGFSMMSLPLLLLIALVILACMSAAGEPNE
jgi:hypothetical protein